MGRKLTSKPNPNDPNAICNAIAKLDRELNSSASPEFVGTTLSGLTANALIYPTSAGVLTSLAAATDGQLIIGSTDAAPSVAALTSTPNQVNVTNGAGSITLSTPQDIDATAIPTFAGLISTGVVRATDFAKTGWPTTPGVTLSFDNASKVFTVTDADSAYYYIDGVKYTLGGNKTVDLDDVGAAEGLWYIYFVGSTLTASQTVWSFKAEDKALVGLLYWDATNSKEIFLGWELHTFHMDGSTHARLHYAGGARWETGLLVTDAGGGTINVSAGDIWDEDLNIPITDDDTPTALFEQILSPAQLPIYYRDGATAWRIYETDEKAATTDVGYLTGGNLQYNKLNGTWANATVTAPNHVAYWVVATNDQAAPIVLIMGQRVDLLIANAKENNIFGNLDLTGLPFEEMVVLARLILKDTGTYSLEEVLDLRAYNIKGNITSPLTSDHGGLAGLGDDDHVHYLLADGTRALAGAWDMGSQALTNVNIDSGVITGITDLLVADGGTGASALTEGGILLGSGTDPITAMDALADGEFIVGNGTTDPVAESGATVRTSLGLGTGDSPTFTALSLGTGELTCGSINRAADTLTLEINGTPQISITSTTVTFAGAVDITGVVTHTDNIIIPNAGWIGSVDTNQAMQIAANGVVLFESGITLDTGADLTVAGQIIFNTNLSYIGFTNPRITFNDTNDSLDITGNITVADDATIGLADGIPRILFDDTQGEVVVGGDLRVNAGSLKSGVSDTTRGYLYLYGGATGFGGSAYFHVPANSDDTIDSYIITPYEDDFRIGTDVDGDIITITAGVAVGITTTLDVTGTITASNYTAANLLTACATSAGDLDFSSDVTLTVAETETTTNYHTDARAATWLAANHETTYTHTDIALNTTHRGLAAGNPHSVTPTELSLLIGTNTQAWDAGLDSLAGLTYVAASFVKMTGANTFALRTIAETADDLEGTIDHANLANLTIAAHDTTATGANLTSLTDDSLVDTLHRHSELSGQTDGTPNAGLIVDTNGQVGIGIALPLGIFHVFKGAAGAAAPDGNTAILLEHSASTFIEFLTPNTAVSGLLMKDDGGVRGSVKYDHSTQDLQIQNLDGAGDIQFYFNGGNNFILRQDGVIVCDGAISIADGDSIFTAGGPVVAFDSTNHYLEITSCNVGIGTETPLDLLHIYKGASGAAAPDGNTTIIIEDNAASFIEFRTPNTTVSGLLFSDDGGARGSVKYDHSTQDLQIQNLDGAGDIQFYFNAGYNFVLEQDGSTKIVGNLNHDGSGVGFYGTAPIAQAVLATGAGATVDNVITALQNLGLVKQA